MKPSSFAAVAAGIAAICCAVAVCAADETVTVDVGGVQYSAKVLGQSGKITFGVASEVTSESDKAVKVEMTGMTEYAADGTATGTKNPKHAVNSFASKTFSFSAIRTGVDYQNVNVSTVDFTATNLVDDSTGSLKVTLMIFEEAGTITVDGANKAVAAGNMKFNVAVDNWPFCTSGGSGLNDCGTDANGAFIDVEMTIKGEKSEASEETEGEEYDLGAGAEVVLAQKVTVDGSLVDMPTGYPKVSTNGGKSVFTFRLPKGTAITYDPIISVSGASDGPASPTNVIGVCVITLLFVLFC